MQKIMIFGFSLFTIYNSAQIGLGTINPHPSAQIDITSKTKGLLPPRMTAVERNAIINPAFGLIIFCTNCGANGEPQFYNGFAWVNMLGTTASEPIWSSNYTHCNPANSTRIIDVTNPLTGKTWMDRNLGANRAAISSTDTQAYGNLFQWGRGADGHQCVNRYVGDGVTTSSTISTLSNTDIPSHGNFITNNSLGFDWKNPQNINLWQGIDGVNNPCPTGYRLPTEAELNSERNSWSSNNALGGFTSPLKLSLSGTRFFINGTLSNVGTVGNYWSSTINNENSVYLYLNSNDSFIYNGARATGFAIRCIKN